MDTFLKVVGSLTLIGLLGFCGLAVLVGTSVESSREDAIPFHGREAAEPVTAPDLVSLYVENEVAADQRFLGKAVLVAGTILDVKKDILGDPYVLLSGGHNAFRWVQAYFDESSQGRLADLRPGWKILLLGRCDGLLVHVMLRGCSIEQVAQ